jgi:hypothetical protein
MVPGDGASGSAEPESDRRERRTMDRLKSALAAAVMLVGVSGAWALAEAQSTIPTDAQRRECERNGGYWDTAADFCKVGSKDKARSQGPAS